MILITNISFYFLFDIVSNVKDDFKKIPCLKNYYSKKSAKKNMI